MAEANINLDRKCKEQDPAYHAVLKDFYKHCKDTILHYDHDESKDLDENIYNTLGDKYNLNNNIPKPVPLRNELVLLMSELAFWIYTPLDLPIPKPPECKEDAFSHWHYKKIVESHKTQISQWAFLQFSGQPKNAFLVFKGTDPEKIFDIMADTAVIPMPIWCDKEHQRTKWEFCGHSGMYATLMRDFYAIWDIITSRISMFDNLYVIGHSLGGGQAILFGLESIINKCLPANKSMHIVTFGAPAVISYECHFELLSRNAKKILSELHNICHCFINRFDPIPRVPARIEWMMTVLPYCLKKIIADQVKSAMKLPNFILPLVKSGVKSGVSKFVQYVEQHLDLLRSYHPIGTHYFFAGNDCDPPFITKNQRVIEELFGFIPPHKIVTSNGEEVRVRHFSTHGAKHKSRFSLQCVTDLTLSKDDKESNDEEKKMDIIELLRRKSEMNNVIKEDGSSLYVAVESVESEEYKNKKLSEKGWIMLVSNHLMEQYIDMFKARVQCKKSKYPMLAPKNVMECNHFGITKESENRKDSYQKRMNFKRAQTCPGLIKNVSALNISPTTAQQPQPYNYRMATQQSYSPQHYIPHSQHSNYAHNQQIGNTQYRIAHQPNHYVVYQQQTLPPKQNLYPSLQKK